MSRLEDALREERERQALLHAELAALALREVGAKPDTVWGQAALKRYRGEPEAEPIRQWIADEYGVTPDGKPIPTEDDR